MNKEEIINNSVKHCCICDNNKYGEFISINDEKYHLCCIEQLQQENKQLQTTANNCKQKINKAIEYMDNEIIIKNIAYDKLYEILKGEDKENE